MELISADETSPGCSDWGLNRSSIESGPRNRVKLPCEGLSGGVGGEWEGFIEFSRDGDCLKSTTSVACVEARESLDELAGWKCLGEL
jgi:hypothetical protein